MRRNYCELIKNHTINPHEQLEYPHVVSKYASLESGRLIYREIRHSVLKVGSVFAVSAGRGKRVPHSKDQIMGSQEGEEDDTDGWQC